METQTTLFAKHQAYLHRHGTYTTNRIIRLLEDADDKITTQLRKILKGLSPRDRRELLKGNFKTQRLVKLRESIRELTVEIRKTAAETLREEGKALAKYELKHNEKVLALSVRGVIETGVTGNQAYAAAMARPIQGRYVRDLVSDLPVSTRKDILASIRLGYVLGETTPQIVSRVSDKFETRNKRAETVVRTSLQHIANVAKLESFKDLDIEEYYLSVVLDGATSKICAGWNPNGIVYYKTGQGPVPPFHMNCRTLMMARVSKKPGGKKPAVKDKRPVSKIPKSERKDKIIRVDADTTFNELLKSDLTFAKDWLGPTRYRLWKDGKLPINRFTDKRNQPLNLDQIRKRDAAAFKRAGL